MTPASLYAARAYAAAATYRSVREQEADVFRRANAALRHARSAAGSALGRTRAFADNQWLWTTVIDLVRDPDNKLPLELRASIVSLGLTVQRELQGESPDIDFLIAVNDSMAEGLGASHP